MTTSAAPVRAAARARPTSRRPGHVVEHVRARVERRLGDQRLPRVDRDDDALGDQPRHQRDDAVALDLRRRHARVRDARLAADVDQVRALLDERDAPARPARRASSTRTASLNESGLALTMPMTSGRPGAQVEGAIAQDSGVQSRLQTVVEEEVVLRPVHVAQRQARRAGVSASPSRIAGAVAGRRPAARRSAAGRRARPRRSAARRSDGPPSQSTPRTPRGGQRLAARRPASARRARSAAPRGRRRRPARRRRRRPPCHHDRHARLAEQRRLVDRQLQPPRHRHDERMRGRPAATRRARWSSSSSVA